MKRQRWYCHDFSPPKQRKQQQRRQKNSRNNVILENSFLHFQWTCLPLLLSSHNPKIQINFSKFLSILVMGCCQILRRTAVGEEQARPAKILSSRKKYFHNTGSAKRTNTQPSFPFPRSQVLNYPIAKSSPNQRTRSPSVSTRSLIGDVCSQVGELCSRVGGTLFATRRRRAPALPSLGFWVVVVHHFARKLWWIFFGGFGNVFCLEIFRLLALWRFSFLQQMHFSSGMSEISPFSSSPYLVRFLSFFDSSFFPFRWGSLKRFLFSNGEWSLIYWKFRFKFCVGGSR